MERHTATSGAVIFLIFANIDVDRVLQATLELQQYAKRLGIVWIAIFAAVSGPIAYQTFDPSQQVCTLPLALLSFLQPPKHL